MFLLPLQLGFIIYVAGLLHLQSIEAGSNFSREHFGVIFDPWVSKTDIGNWNSYEEKDLIIMIDKISSKFKRILMRSIPPTLPHNPDSRLNIPNAVAHFNKRRFLQREQCCMELIMSAQTDLLDPDLVNYTKSSFELTKELADNANLIHPNTVTNLWVDLNGLSASNVNLAAQQLQVARIRINQSSSGVHRYQLGVRLHDAHEIQSSKYRLILLPLLALVDVVVISKGYYTADDDDELTESDQVVFGRYTRYFTGCKHFIVNELRAGVDVQFVVSWTYDYNNTPAGVRNMKRMVDFWNFLDEFARKTNTKVWMYEAFDNASRQGERYRTSGWWRLVENPLYTSVSEYVFEDKEEVVALIEEAEENKRLTGSGVTNETHSKEGLLLLRELTLRSQLSPTHNVTFPTGTNNVLEGRSSGNFYAILFTSLGVGLVLIVTLVWLISYFMYKRVTQGIRRGMMLTTQELREFFEGQEVRTFSGHPTTTEELYNNSCYNNKRFELARNSFEIRRQQILGAGAFGVVFRGSVRRPGGNNEEIIEVAVKTTKPGCPANAIKGLMGEIKVMSYLGEHENVVRLLGAYTAELHQGKIYVFTEFCAHGSLEKYLRQLRRPKEGLTKSPNLELASGESNPCWSAGSLKPDLERWAHDICCGMEFLASKHVVHADLATRNVLLTEHKTAKISDFGLSRRMYEYMTYVKQGQEPLPWKWMAPESLAHSEFNEKSDVWAYGVTLWEIFSLGDSPYAGLNWSADWVARLNQGLRLEKPALDTKNMYFVMTKCWNLDPGMRPFFSDLKHELEVSEDEIEDNNCLEPVYRELVDERSSASASAVLTHH